VRGAGVFLAGPMAALGLLAASPARPAEVPLIRQIAAGVSLDAQEAVEGGLRAAEGTCRPRRAVHAAGQGDSMTGAAIIDGDLVVIRKQETTENGEIVAASSTGPSAARPQ
jgi:repressor LexA